MDLRRRRHRIIYQTKIRLRAADRDDSVVARVQNLSPRGVFVTAPEIPAAGTELQCRLTLAGERRTLRGRVAWVRPASNSLPQISAGAGIEFLDLEERDEHLLSRLVQPAADAESGEVVLLPSELPAGGLAPVDVDVWFEGLKAPVRCHASVGRRGLRLATRLAFMRLGSPVAVRYIGDDRPAQAGSIESVILEPGDDEGVPRLELRVTLDSDIAGERLAESAGGLIEVPSEPRPTNIQSAPQTGTPVLPSTVIDPGISSPPPPPRVMSSAAEQTVRIGAASRKLAMGRARVAAWMRQPSRGAPAQLRPLLLSFLAGVLLTTVLALALSPRASRPEVSRPAVVATPVSTVPAAPKAPEPAPARSAPTPQLPVAEPDPPAATSAPADPSGPFQVATDDNQGVRLTVPLLGTAKGAEQYRLAEPPGLAITLPRGRPRVASGVYRPEGAPVRVQVRRRNPGSHLRFFYDSQAWQAILKVEGDDLVLRLAPR